MGNSWYKRIKFSKVRRTRRGAYLSCLYCKKEFYVMPSRLNWNNVKYCSNECYHKTMFGNGNPFWGHKHSEDSKRKFNSHPNRHKFKSGKEHMSFLRYGEIIPLKKQDKYTKLVGKCERCGFSDVRILMTHHKDRNRKNNRKINIEVLCPNCHHLDHYLNHDGMYHLLRKIDS